MQSSVPPAPLYTRPHPQIFWMSAALASVVVVALFLGAPLVEIFRANRWLNGLILAVFCIGVAACFWQALRLGPAVRWAERFAASREGLTKPPRLLASMSAMLGPARQHRTLLSEVTAQSVIDAVHGRVSESRDLARYIAGLLIFLGLLGTFWGLSLTIPALIETIRSLTPEEGEAGLGAFERLSAGFEKQLNAMGTAFSSSLLGLAGSLVVGLLDLLAGHAQTRFLREFEEWVGSVTQVDAPTGYAQLRAQVDRLTLQLNSLGGAGPGSAVRQPLRNIEMLATSMAAENRASPELIAELRKQLALIHAQLGGPVS